MRIIIIIPILFSIGNNCSSQISLFNKLCLDSLVTQDFLYAINTSSTSFELLPSQSSIDELKHLFASDIYSVCTQKYGGIKYSKMLQQMSEFACHSWKGSNYNDKKKWSKLDKRFRRAKRKTTAGFTIVKCISFRINLTESNHKKVYYDEENGDGKFNLFYGLPLSKKEIEDGKTAMPVSEISIENLRSDLIKKLKSQHLFTDLRKGVYSSLGISIKLDEKTVGKNTFPTARVVIFLGAKRLQRIKIK